jgi:glycosyltransferase involved in cell wall biosynthesis
VKISTVTPIYNTNPVFLKKCVDSILYQEYKPFEIFLVNDGSTRKETLNCLDEFRKDERLTIIDQENKKTCGALNAGIRAMTGDWWAGLSSDDMWMPYKLKMQVEFAHHHQEAKVIYGDYRCIEADGSIAQKRFIEPVFNSLKQQQQFIIRSYFGMWSNMLVHKSVFDKVGTFNEEFIACEDYEMLVRISQYYLYYKIPEVLTSYRKHSEQITVGDYGFQGKIGCHYNMRCQAMAMELFGIRTKKGTVIYWGKKVEKNIKEITHALYFR